MKYAWPRRTGAASLYFCEDSETVVLTTQGSGLVAGSQDGPWGDRRWSKAQNFGYAGRVWSCRTQAHSQQDHTCTCTLTDLMGNVLTPLTNRLTDVLQGRGAVTLSPPDQHQQHSARTTLGGMGIPRDILGHTMLIITIKYS